MRGETQGVHDGGHIEHGYGIVRCEEKGVQRVRRRSLGPHVLILIYLSLKFDSRGFGVLGFWCFCFC
jgi:hypothetical protein